MIPSQFYQAVKSTVDYLGHQIAAEVRSQMPEMADLGAFTLDATTGVQEQLTSSAPAIVWSLQSFSASPVDPLYRLQFLIGPKTTSDVSGELMTVLTGAIQNQLPDKANFPIKNYSGPVVSEELGERGVGYVTGSSVQDQMYDNQSSIRMAVVFAVISRDIS